MTHNPGFKVTVLFEGECFKKGAFSIAQLRIHLHRPNLQCNVLLTRSPSAIAESLVSYSYVHLSYSFK